MLLWKKWIEILNSLIAETTSKASPEKGVSKLAAWTTANSAVLDVEWFDSTHGNSPDKQTKTVKERADKYAL